jgi:hypothetical protein
MRYEINKNKVLKVHTDFNECVKLAVSMPVITWSKLEDNASLSNSYGDDFYGDAGSFGAMVDRCYDGYNAKKISDKRHSIGNMLSVLKDTQELGFVGDELDIPTFLSGDMKCWWRSVTEEGTPKRVHLVYDGATPWHIKPDNYANHGGAISSLCDVLVDDGYSVKISAVFSIDEIATKGYYHCVTIKDYDESLDVPRIGAVTHASFLRRIIFSYSENFCSYVNIPIKDQINPIDSDYGRIIKGFSVISDEEAVNWLGLSDEEAVIMVKSPAEDVFLTTKSACDYVADSVVKIKDIVSKNETTSNIIKL